MNDFLAESHPPPRPQHLPRVPSPTEIARFASARGAAPTVPVRAPPGSYPSNAFQAFGLGGATSNEDALSHHSSDDDGSSYYSTEEDAMALGRPLTNPRADPQTKLHIAPLVQPVLDSPLQQKQQQQQPQKSSTVVTALPTTLPQEPVAEPSNAQSSVADATVQSKTSDKAAEQPLSFAQKSSAFFKRNFWPILILVCMLVSIGLAFIFFAHRPSNSVGVAQSAAAMNSSAAAATAAALSGDPTVDVVHAMPPPHVDRESKDAKLAAQLRTEREQAEQERLKLQSSLLAIEKDVSSSNLMQQKQLTELHEMYARAEEERLQLLADNTTLLQIIDNASVIDDLPDDDEPVDSLPPTEVKITVVDEERGEEEQNQTDEAQVELSGVNESSVVEQSPDAQLNSAADEEVAMLTTLGNDEQSTVSHSVIGAAELYSPTLATEESELTCMSPIPYQQGIEDLPGSPRVDTGAVLSNNEAQCVDEPVEQETVLKVSPQIDTVASDEHQVVNPPADIQAGVDAPDEPLTDATIDAEPQPLQNNPDEQPPLVDNVADKLESFATDAEAQQPNLEPAAVNVDGPSEQRQEEEAKEDAPEENTDVTDEIDAAN